MKKTICLVTNWYPNKENPYAGLFFREQAIAVRDNFDFLVLHYNEKNSIWPKTSYSVSFTNEEQNIREYQINISFSACVLIKRLFEILKIKNGKKVDINAKEQAREKIIKRIFSNKFVNEFDALYCVDAQSEAKILQDISKCTGKPYIVGEHAPVPWPGTVVSEVNKMAISEADAYFAISNDKIRQLMLLNIKLPKTVYIGNLIDETSLRMVKNEQHDIKTLVIVAAHSYYKNYDMFIAVMNRLTEITSMPFKVRIVGYAANKGYSKGVDEFEQQINSSKFADCVEMIPELSHADIEMAYIGADAFVMTSIQEGQPVSPMEAACCGLPVFSTRCGGVEDYIDENMGRIYAITDVDGMAYGLKDFVEGRISFDPKYIRNKVVEKFGTDKFVKLFAEAFNEIIEND